MGELSTLTSHNTEDSDTLLALQSGQNKLSPMAVGQQVNPGLTQALEDLATQKERNSEVCLTTAPPQLTPCVCAAENAQATFRHERTRGESTLKTEDFQRQWV